MNKTQKLKLIGFVCILCFALVFVGLNILQAQSKGKPDKPGKPEPTAPLILNSGDIVTAESNAMRVWDCSIDAYDSGNPVWSTKTPGHFSVGIGNVDDDDSLEIVVPEIKGTVKGGKKGPSNFKIFLNVYKEGESGIWHSTEDYAYLTDDVRHAQVIVADVDGISGDEVVLLTYENLSIFNYVGGNSELFTVTQKTTEDFNVYNFVAIAAGNVSSENPGDEIIVSAFDRASDREYLFILDMSLDTIYTIDDDLLLNTYSHSICATNLDEDGADEICSTGSVYCGSDDDGVLWQARVFVWDLDLENDQWTSSSLLIPGWEIEPVHNYPYLCVDASELNGESFIAVSANSGYDEYYLYVYNYDDGIQPNPTLLFLVDAAHVYDVEVGDVSGNPPCNKIVVAGRANGVADFYLEVFDSYLDSLWKRIGDKPKEGMVFDTAIVK